MADRSLLASLSSFVSSFALAGCSVFGIRSGYEQPRYDVVATLGGGVEVRRYGPRLVAETVVEGNDEEAARNAAFRILAGYIFGANAGEREVAMTAPVEVAREGSEIAMTAPVAVAPAQPGRYVMRFFLPSRYELATAPAPTDPRVRLLVAPPETVAVLPFTGSTAPSRVAARAAELQQLLASSAWRAIGEPTALFYDPPWTIPWLRRNEVAVAVEQR